MSFHNALNQRCHKCHIAFQIWKCFIARRFQNVAGKFDSKRFTDRKTFNANTFIPKQTKINLQTIILILEKSNNKPYTFLTVEDPMVPQHQENFKMFN